MSQHNFGVATRRAASWVGFVPRHDPGCRDSGASVRD